MSLIEITASNTKTLFLNGVKIGQINDSPGSGSDLATYSELKNSMSKATGLPVIGQSTASPSPDKIDIASSALALIGHKEFLSNERFKLYGGEFKHVSALELANDEDCVSRVETSGSEGFIVEVVRWVDSAWQLYAHCKYFEENEARHMELIINANSAFAPVFYSLLKKNAVPS